MRYFILLFSFIFLSCSTKPKDCSMFRTGTFKYKDSNLSNWSIKRNDSIQIEFNKKDNITIIGAVNWISNCKYTLLYKEVSNNPNDIRIGMKINIDIKETSKYTYKYEAYNYLHKTKGQMIKID